MLNARLIFQSLAGRSRPKADTLLLSGFFFGIALIRWLLMLPNVIVVTAAHSKSHSHAGATCAAHVSSATRTFVAGHQRLPAVDGDVLHSDSLIATIFNSVQSEQSLLKCCHHPATGIDEPCYFYRVRLLHCCVDQFKRRFVCQSQLVRKHLFQAINPNGFRQTN